MLEYLRILFPVDDKVFCLELGFAVFICVGFSTETRRLTSSEPHVRTASIFHTIPKSVSENVGQASSLAGSRGGLAACFRRQDAA